MVQVSVKIKRILIDSGLVSENDWNHARDKGGSVLDSLLNAGTLQEDSLLEAVGRSSSIAPVDIGRITPDPRALEAIPQELCRERQVLPLSRNGDILTLAVVDPFDVLLFDDLRRRTGCQIRQLVTQPVALQRAFERVYRTGAQQVETLLGEVNASADLEVKVETDNVQELGEVGA
ncbi:MAG: hypothetical protein ACKO32_05005, partial [Planctomycetia bacterium]